MALQRENSVGYMTNLAARLLVRELERRLAPLGLQPACMPVLLALEDGPLPQKTIAARAHVEQPTMTATLGRMEQAGLVSRTANPDDGRSMLVSLTPLARDRLPDVEAAVSAINEQALSGLDAAERASYFALLGKIVAALDAERESARRG